MTNNFLVLKDVSCGYGDNFNIKNISCEIPKGKITGIIGPNGSGKSTLFKGIVGDLKLNKGSVTLDNCDLRQMPLRKRAKQIAIVSQFIESIDISVQEYVLLGRMPYRKAFHFFETTEDIGIAEKFMRLTDVFHLKNKLMNQLSGGEQQLVSIARALTQEPKLLLLDEPTSHLDITHQVHVLNLIQELSVHLDLTVVIIIHDLNLAGEYCDHLLMMNNGQLHFQGTPHEVLTYQNIEDVYHTVVITQTNPLSKRPAVFLVSKKVIEKNKEM